MLAIKPKEIWMFLTAAKTTWRQGGGWLQILPFLQRPLPILGL